jgi:hypothetical protein
MKWGPVEFLRRATNLKVMGLKYSGVERQCYQNEQEARFKTRVVAFKSVHSQYSYL